jgi:hypothetical protein
MKRPAELQQLIEDLKAEKPGTGVVAQADSKLVVVVEDTEARFEFTADEAKLLLSSRDSIERLFEALDFPSETLVELQNLTIDEEVMGELEAYASTVDEL